MKRAPLLLSLLAACAPATTRSGTATLEPDLCTITAGTAEIRDTLVIAVSDALDGQHAPVPSNDSERLAFRQAYERLVRLDCQGQLRAGLASEWVADSSRSAWTFRLRDAQLDDGSTLVAADVVASWARHGLADRRPWLARVRTLSGSELAVTFTAPEPNGPLALADPALAVGVPRREARWPEATAAFRFESDSVAVSRFGGRPSVLVFRYVAGRDLRDLLAAGTDLAVTDEPSVIAYAKGLPQFEVAPLPWSRTYLLVSPTAPPLDTGPDSVSQRRFRAALARDAVRVDARAAEPPFAWETAFACRTEFAGTSRPARRVVYAASDPTARALAERIVALSPMSGGALVIAGLPEPELELSLREGADAAYVLAFPLVDPGSCRDYPALPAGTTVEPLVDIRRHLILRRGSARVTVDGDGVPRVVP